ncbi:MAG: UDP-4-amino-4,6-dideoxy-N-acetyl-beta-L-altrosamine transaminase [Gammaproteobacteria bacterium]
MIPYGRQEISAADIDAVVEVLRSDFLTQGPKVPAFEQALCAVTGAQYSVVVSSATAALHLACRALDVKPGDLVWTSDITFVASANCALYCGAKVDFIDIDLRTYNLSPVALEARLKSVRAAGGLLPKVVIPVHLCGQSCDMAAISALSREYGFSIIEDASHAVGARYEDQPIGDCRYSDITVFSFHPVKIITTGEGGAAMTNNAALAGRMALLRSHGITREEPQMSHAADGPWYYQQIDLGFNYRMTDLQAALGLSQLAHLESWVSARNRLAERYDRLLVNLPVAVPWQHPDAYSSRHLYVIRLAADQGVAGHRKVFNALRAGGIGVNLHYIPLHTQPYFVETQQLNGGWPEADRYYEQAISLPMFHHMTDEQQDRVVEVLGAALE